MRPLISCYSYVRQAMEACVSQPCNFGLEAKQLTHFQARPTFPKRTRQWIFSVLYVLVYVGADSTAPEIRKGTEAILKIMYSKSNLI